MDILHEPTPIPNLPTQESHELSWKEAYDTLQDELIELRKQNKILEKELKIKEDTEYEMNTQKIYLETIVEELVVNQDLLEEGKKNFEALIEELEVSKRIAEKTVEELEFKQSEVEMQQQYMADIILQLEASEKEISDKNKILERTSTLINRAYENITDSINYAKRIQDAMLPAPALLKDWFQDYFILFEPTSIVSGDFYWFTQVKNKVIVVAADCTGHGIPGAFMSILAIESLHYIVNVQGVDNADQIINLLHENTRTLLRQHETKNMDGMDIALVIIDLKHKILEYAGANNSLILIKNNEFIKVKADRFAVGGYQREEKREFTKHVFHVKEGDTFYIYSDGYQDMCGGPDSRRFMSQRFRHLLHEISLKEMRVQKMILSKVMRFWLRHETKHLDDVLVLGVRI